MTSSVIQWDDDWFSVGEEGGKEKKEPLPSAVQELQDSPPSVVVPSTVEAPKPEEDWKWRIEVLEALVQQQVEKIEALEKEVQLLKDRPPLAPPAPPSPLMNHVSIAQLLEEWKQVKQRELNYALRRRQPVPFFSVESWLKWEQATGSKSVLASKGSPLFRHQVMKEWEKDRQTMEKEEKEIEALMKGLDAIKL